MFPAEYKIRDLTIRPPWAPAPPPGESSSLEFCIPQETLLSFTCRVSASVCALFPRPCRRLLLQSSVVAGKVIRQANAPRLRIGQDGYVLSGGVSAKFFRNSSSRRNLRPNAPEYADHSGSPVSCSRAARTAASFESRSSR